MNRPRILVADDHRMVAEGLRSVLEPDFELIEIVEIGRALVEAALRLRPDIIVADITMPQLNGLDAVEQIRRSGCDAKVIFLTMHKTALRRVLEGRTYVTPEIAELLDRLPATPARGADETVLLTPRQREVLQLYAEGYSARDVAKILHISSRTAENHKAQIMAALGVNSTADLVRCAIRHGLIAPA